VDTLSAPLTIAFDYTRSLGPVLGRFMAGLRERRVLGGRTSDGRVHVPPLEYDPITHEPVTELVEVFPTGTVVTWAWMANPIEGQPLDRPFGWALIRLDGADTPMLHAVDAGSPDAMSTGMRVAAQFREERTGAITDVYFVPETSATPQDIIPGEEPVAITTHLVALTISEPLYPHRVRFASGLLEGRIIGQRSPVSGKVYVPSSGYDNMSRAEMTEADDVEVSDRGSVSSFTVITPIQYYGQKETEPYIRASILLDGADQPLGQQDIKTIPIGEFRAGMRVRAVWKPAAERSILDVDNRWGGTGSVIERWEPTGEPDVPFEKIMEHNW
jgi:uncharacterized OB-fold protein